jgi:transposase
LVAKQGVATIAAATLLATTGGNPGRVRREASLAALCGASPADASCGKQIRHRVNRGGGRQANSALRAAAMTRLALRPAHQGLRRPADRRRQTRKEIIRCLKRYLARETYKAPCRPQRPGTPPAPQVKQDLSAPALT